MDIKKKKILVLIVLIAFTINIIVFIKLALFTDSVKMYKKEEYSNIVLNKEEL